MHAESLLLASGDHIVCILHANEATKTVCNLQTNSEAVDKQLQASMLWAYQVVPLMTYPLQCTEDMASHADLVEQL